jgi:transposase
MKLPGAHGLSLPARVAVGGRELCEQLDGDEGCANETMNVSKNEKDGYKPRRQYDDNFKRHAVDLTLQGDRTIRQVADELGLKENLLWHWRRKYVARPGVHTGAPQSLEEATKEIERLRSEVVRLQERENVLKKSLGILSETPGSGMPRSKQ